MALRDGDRRVQYRRADGGVFNIDPNSEMGRDWIANNPGAEALKREARSMAVAEPVEVEAGGDINAMNLSQLKRYAAANEIELGDATKKPDVLAKIVEALNARGGADGNNGGNED